MKANIIKKSVAKVIRIELQKEFESPLKLINWINKNLKTPTSLSVDGVNLKIYELLGLNESVKRINLDFLLNYVQGDTKQVCELVKVTDTLYFEDCPYITPFIACGAIDKERFVFERKTVGGNKVTNVYYLRPVPFTIEGFISSINSARKLDVMRSDYCAAIEKELATKEAKAAKELAKEQKRQEKEAGKKPTTEETVIKKIVESLKLIPCYHELNKAQLYALAEKMYHTDSADNTTTKEAAKEVAA